MSTPPTDPDPGQGPDPDPDPDPGHGHGPDPVTAGALAGPPGSLARAPRIDPAVVDRAAAIVEAIDAGSTHHDPCHEGRRIRWRHWGAGAPVLLVHGGHGNWLHWLRWVEPLARRHSVWVPDLPGYGDSDDLPTHRHAPDRQQWLVRALRDTWRQLPGSDRPVALVGFSFGGLVAGQLIADGLAVRRLALLGTAAHRTPRGAMPPLVNWRFGDRARALAILEHNLRALMLHDRQRDDDLALLAHERASRAARYRSKDLSQQADLGRLLAAFDGPLRMIWGRHDVTVASAAAAARRVARHRAAPDLHVIAGAGHWVQYEAAAESLALVDDWLIDDGSID